ncbi:hypothetical protein F5X99DRAFT_417223 [Biscogniauxia marginata]|nr:hypothetical protein F5X99DRAFT_417223 [Biscogniauxia marginata]
MPLFPSNIGWSEQLDLLLVSSAALLTYVLAMRLQKLGLVIHLTWAHSLHARVHDGTPSQQCMSGTLGPLDPRTSYIVCPLLIDDDTSFERHSWHPWTFPPVCIQAENGVNSKLCTFTYANLRGESGISIVTTPEIASAGMGVLEDPDPQWANWERGYTYSFSERPPYEIKDIEGKGLGVVANRSIHRGEVIMTRYPVILRMIDTMPWKHQDVLKLLHRAGIQLPTKEKAGMMSLANSKGGYIVDDIMNTNSFGVLLDGIDHQGLYLDVSRINHACKPNLFSRFSSTTLAMEVVAYYEIKEGEELTFSYTPLNLLSEQRQALIREWGFNCTCSLCASHQDLVVSDRRQASIQRLLEELENPKLRSDTAINERVLKILELCHDEGLEAQIGEFYMIIADIYFSVGDLDSAKSYGELAVKELRYYAGYDNERTTRAIMFLEGLDKRLRI